MITKSKIMAARQCDRKVWLLEHRKDLSAITAENQDARSRGSELGVVAQSLYSAPLVGVTVNPFTNGFAFSHSQTAHLLSLNAPIFEGTFIFDDQVVMSDILTREADGWKMVEVKSATQLKGHYVDDIAVQVAIARKSGAAIHRAAVGLVNSDFVYPGDGDYNGLIVEVDVTSSVELLVPLVDGWIDHTRGIIASDKEPACSTGSHCKVPYECEFMAYCQAQEVPVRNPASWLPNVRSKALKSLIHGGAKDMVDIPDVLLNEQQAIVKACTVSRQVYFDQEGAKMDLAPYQLPIRFLDFETGQFVVPVWSGTRPYQQIPFQASIHTINEGGHLLHTDFLDLTGGNPLRGMAEFLVDQCGDSGAIFVYYASFEMARIKEMIALFSDLAPRLLRIAERIVDLLPVANKRFYHPSQRGSWSIKNVLPAIVPELSYAGLDGVNDGVKAMTAYREALDNLTDTARCQSIAGELRTYCHRDTYGLVKLWEYFSGCVQRY